MTTSGALVAFQHGDECGQTGATSGSKLHNPSVKEVLTGQSIAQGAVDRRGQPFPGLGPGQVDEGSGGGHRRDAVHLSHVQSGDVATAVDDVTNPIHRSIARDHEVKGRR